MRKGFRPNFGSKIKQKPKTPVVIAFLTMDQEINTKIMQFLIHCLSQNANPEHPYLYTYCLIENYRPVEYARNLAVKEFRKATANMPDTAKLWFIDNDMAPPSNFEEQLAMTDCDMGAGRVYGVFDHQLFGCVYRVVGEQTRQLALDPHARNTIDVDASGTGGLWISKKVLDDKRLWLTPEGDLFQTLHEPDGKVKLSEDLDFTLRASRLGYKLKAHLGVRWAHYKYVDLAMMEGKAGTAVMDEQLALARAARAQEATQTPSHPFKDQA